MESENRKTTRLILRIIGAIILFFSLIIFWDILVPDKPDPFDPKPNLEEDLKPIKISIARTFLVISSLFFLVSFIFRKRKN